MTTLATVRPNLENAMVMGDFGYDSDYEYYMEHMTGEDAVWYAWDKDLMQEIMEDWLGIKLTEYAALDIWDNMQEDKLEKLCAKYVKDKSADGYVDWKMRKDGAA